MRIYSLFSEATPAQKSSRREDTVWPEEPFEEKKIDRKAYFLYQKYSPASTGEYSC